jgi:hypothetical protein
MSASHKASCLCGGVKFAVAGRLRDVVACHCVQYRKQTGNYMSATGCADEALTLTSTDGLAWYESTPGYTRGFCSTCGSTLFWKANGSDRIAIAAGVFDAALDVPLKGHIYCDFAGDYYEIAGGEFQEPLSDEFSDAKPET